MTSDIETVDEDDVALIAEKLASMPDLAQRMQIIASSISGRVTFSSSLGIEDQAILHAIAQSGATIDVFTLDTGRLFPETIEVLAQSERRYDLKLRVLTPSAASTESLVARDGVLGFRWSIDARKACCHVRKVEPLDRALAGARGWITGLRRGQSRGRTDVPFAIRDEAHALIKINPLADWSLDRLEDYVARQDIPINALHARGFPSIGCYPCTRAVQPGEDIRSGRWWWESEDGKECGLHNNPKRKAAVE